MEPLDFCAVPSHLDFGLKQDHFATAWLRLKPDQEAPDVRQRKHTFRLQPLPVGTDKDIFGQMGSSGAMGHSPAPIHWSQDMAGCSR